MTAKLTSLEAIDKETELIHKKLSHTTAATEAIVDKHLDIFKGIGKHKYRQVELSIDDSVKPKAQPQRRIPFPKHEQLDKILDELEQADIIEPVEGPTGWGSNIVLTPKADTTELRMTIDMTTANMAIKRTRHVIPTLEELKYKLNGSKHFSKLDMRQGYMQFELKETSRHMTCFYTPRGPRKFKRLNYGTNSAAELFHEEIHQLLVDIDNAENIYDDILIYGKTKQEHDKALARVLQRLQDCGLTLNQKKCIFDQSEVIFFGMKFSGEWHGTNQSPYRSTYPNASPRYSSRG